MVAVSCTVGILQLGNEGYLHMVSQIASTCMMMFLYMKNKWDCGFKFSMIDVCTEVITIE